MASGVPNWSIDEDIYIGFWINRSVGTFRGAVLTLDRQTGGLLIAFIALFVGATGRSLWKIIRFLLHTVHTAPTTQDGIYHQRQAILRNTPLAHDSALEFILASIAWRGRAKEAGSGVLPAASLAATIAIVSVAAGIPAQLFCYYK